MIEERTLYSPITTDLHETDVILQLSCENDFDHASMVYRAAWTVFKSLPPLSLLQNFSSAAYDEWYSSRFTDSADGWHSGPDLYKKSESCFLVITPTSKRQVFAEFRDGKLWTCVIQFPSGSVSAASRIIEEFRALPDETEPSIWPHAPQRSIDITVINANGKYHEDIRDIKITRMNTGYNSFCYRLGESIQPPKQW